MSQSNHPQPPDLVQTEGTNIQTGIAQTEAADLDGFLHTILENRAVREQLGGLRYRVLGTRTMGPSKDTDGIDASRTCALVYDYTNNRMLEIAVDTVDSEHANIAPSSLQIPPSSDEWEEAVEIVRRDEQFGRWIICGLLVPYRAMPALVLEPGPTGVSARTVTVGLLPTERNSLPHQIVAVNMVTQRVHTFERGHPDISLAGATTCGIPPVYCPSP